MTKPITLYRHALSGHSHRVELLLSLLGLPCDKVDVDVTTGAHKTPAFLAKNALGQLPVIEDGEVTLSDSNAILVYLALRYDEPRRFLPREPVAAAEVQRYLSLAAGELAAGPGLLRLAVLFKRTVDRTQPEQIAARLLGFLEGVLKSRPFLVGSDVTLADVAQYAYTAHAPEGGVSLEPYPALRAWHTRVEALPGFVPMVRTPRRAE